MITEIETLYTRLDKLPMTPADRELAKARLEQAEAFAEGLHALLAALGRLLPSRHGQGPHHPGLRPSA